MAKQIIILERVHEPSDMTFRVAFWAAVPVARQAHYADPAATSEYEDASAAELTVLQVGQGIERVETIVFPIGATLAQIKTKLEGRWQTIQDAVNARNPWVKYGTTWDGTTWTAGGVS